MDRGLAHLHGVLLPAPGRLIAGMGRRRVIDSAGDCGKRLRIARPPTSMRAFGPEPWRRRTRLRCCVLRRHIVHCSLHAHPSPPSPAARARRRPACGRASRSASRTAAIGRSPAAGGRRWPCPRASAWDALSSRTSSASRRSDDRHWDLRPIEQLDHIGAQLLWNHWRQAWPRAPRNGFAAQGRAGPGRAVHLQRAGRTAADAGRPLQGLRAQRPAHDVRGARLPAPHRAARRSTSAS